MQVDTTCNDGAYRSSPTYGMYVQSTNENFQPQHLFCSQSYGAQRLLKTGHEEWLHSEIDVCGKIKGTDNIPMTLGTISLVKPTAMAMEKGHYYTYEQPDF